MKWILLLFAGLNLALADDRPNVLMIAVDDLNHWVGHLGRNKQAKTPNIDRLAERGMTFEHAYCAVPACEPSRCALMSGRRPWTTGCYLNGDGWKNYQKPGEGLSARFMKAGYHVSGAGKIYHANQIYREEWHEYLSRGEVGPDGKGVTKLDGYFNLKTFPDLKDEDLFDWHAVDYCVERLKRVDDRPFFVACGLYKPHLPFVVPRKYYEQFPLDEIELPPYREDDLGDLPAAGVKMAQPGADHARFKKDERQWKTAIQSYLAACAYTDMNVGRLLEALDKSGERDRTIILLWGDHGWSFGEKHHWRKFALWEEPTRMPYLWVVPGMTTAGSRCATPVDLMSVYPTLCDLTDIPKPDHVEGPSLRPLLTDAKAEWELPAISTHGYGNHSIRSGDWRYISYKGGGEELYNHKNDPYEWNNLADNKEHAGIIAEMKGWLPQKQKPWAGKRKAGKGD